MDWTSVAIYFKGKPKKRIFTSILNAKDGTGKNLAIFN